MLVAVSVFKFLGRLKEMLHDEVGAYGEVPPCFRNCNSQNKRKVSWPRSLETRCHTLGSSPVVNDLLQLVDNCNPKSALMDRLLLKLSTFFAVIYTCFAITISIFPSSGGQDLLSRLYVVDEILKLEKTVFQVVFIELPWTKTIRCLVLSTSNQTSISLPVHWFLQGILHPWNWPTLPFWVKV